MTGITQLVMLGLRQTSMILSNELSFTDKECTHSRRALHAFSWKLQYKTDVNEFPLQRTQQQVIRRPDWDL